MGYHLSYDDYLLLRLLLLKLLLTIEIIPRYNSRQHMGRKGTRAICHCLRLPPAFYDIQQHADGSLHKTI